MNPTKGNAGSGKYDSAVARATGMQASADAGTTSIAPLPKGATAMLSKPSQEDINAIMADPELEFAPQVHSLEEGEMVTGILEGKGPSTTFTQLDPSTQRMVTREVDTWVIRNPTGGQRISILSSVQLDKKLPPFRGALVRIHRGEDVKTRNGFKVTNYTVAGPWRANKEPRSFVQPEVIDVPARTIDGPSTPQLPAGETPTAAQGGEDATA